MAGAGAHDHKHFARRADAGCRCSDVCIDDGNADSRPFVQAAERSAVCVDLAGLCAERVNIAREFFIDDMCQTRIQLAEEFCRRIAICLVPHGFIPCRARTAAFQPCELHDDPVAGFDQFIGAFIDFRRLVENLPRLREQPFRGNFSAVASQTLRIFFDGKIIDAIGVFLRRMVFPQFDIGVRVGLELVQEAERRTVCENRQDGAGCEVHRDADDIIRRHAGLRQDGRNRFAQDFQIISRMLECPVRREFGHAVRHVFIHDSMRIVAGGRRDFAPGFHLDEQRTAAQRAEIDTDCIFHRFIRRPPALIRGGRPRSFR